MSAELWAAVIGAIVGSVLTGGAAYLQQRYSRKQAREDRIRDGRMTLVREVVRYRLDQKAVIGPLNEIPLLFGHDETAMRLYRETLNAAKADDRTRSLTDLVKHLATAVGLEPSVQISDIARGFYVLEVSPQQET